MLAKRLEEVAHNATDFKGVHGLENYISPLCEVQSNLFRLGKI